MPDLTVAQYAPPAGQPGSTAISADSAVFIAWAASCTVERGYMDLSDTLPGYAWYGSDTSGVGIADNNVVSLGDGGMATAYFDTPVVDGPGYDFAVFENSFNDVFLELAFVEVSSDGSHFYRFENTSNTPVDQQVEPFGSIDATHIHNLAGKYRGGYGTPFDLKELKKVPGLDISNIVAIRMVDVVGSIDPAYATYDSQGIMVNDPWPTPFETSGFDLDAVGVIHDQLNSTVGEQHEERLTANPNPVKEELHINGLKPISEVFLFDQQGRMIYASGLVNGAELTIPVSRFPKGLLFIVVKNTLSVQSLKIIHL